MLLTLAALVGWESLRGRLCSQGTRAPSLGTGHSSSGFLSFSEFWHNLALINFLTNGNTRQKFHFIVTMKQLINDCWEVLCCWSIVLSRWANKTWPEAVYCNYIGKEVSIECRVTLHWGCQTSCKWCFEIASWILLLTSKTMSKNILPPSE